VTDATDPPKPTKSAAARIARVLQLDRGRIRTLLLAACVVFGRPTWTSLAVGAAIIVPGAFLHLWTKGCLRIGAEVTTSGPYRWTRNPFYLATLVVDVGLCVVAWNPWIAAAYLPLWFVVHGLTIRREERVLTEFFGARYEAYRARVPRLFPWKGPATDLPSSTGFTWSNPQLVDGVEYARLVRTIAAPLLVFVGARLIERRVGFVERPDAGEVACAAAFVVLFLVEWALAARSVRRKARRQAAPPRRTGEAGDL
jgi:hypothetical protein